MSVKINFDVNGFKLDAELANGICHFNPHSGSGVSYAFHLLTEYFRSRGIPYLLLDEKTSPAEAKEIIENLNVRYLLLDNANCYLDPIWLMNIDYGKSRVLVHEHQPLGFFKLPLDLGMHAVSFDENMLKISPVS